MISLVNTLGNEDNVPYGNEGNKSSIKVLSRKEMIDKTNSMDVPTKWGECPRQN